MDKKKIQEALNRIRARVAKQYRDDELWEAIEDIQKEIGVRIETEVERVVKFQRRLKRKKL